MRTGATTRRVLIVEDDFLVAEKLRGMLEDEGYIVIGDTVSGKKSVEMVGELQPDLVMMDINLPEMDGLAAARRITARSPLPIVALTAHDQPDLIAEAGESGIGYYVVKPASQREIARAIEIATARFEDLANVRRLNRALRDEIAEHKRTQAALHGALSKAQRHERELAWLLKASQAVMVCHTFEDAARRIFDVAREATGAVSGYVAMMSEDGTENDLLFLEAGGLPCAVDPDLPMPIRGLRAEAYARGTVVYENEFAQSDWMRFIPPQHVEMRNVLFAPLNIGDHAVGVMGLANKPMGFTDDDVRITGALGDMVAIALRRTQIEDALRESEERFDLFMQHLPAAVSIKDTEERVIYANDRFAAAAGCEVKDLCGTTTSDLLPEDLHTQYQRENHRVLNGETVISESNIPGPEGPTSWITYKFPIYRKGKSAYVGSVSLDITERKQAEQALQESEHQLARYAADLKRSNRELEQFGYVVSHDLRAPLRTVKGFVDLLRNRYGDQFDAKALEYIDYATEGVERMREMIQALLDLSRVETRGRALRPIDAEGLLDRSLRALRAEIENAGAQITHDPLPTVMADEAQLVQVFQNLIANAIKFHREGVPPHVHVTAREGERGGEGEGAWVFAITDNGIGLDPDQADHLFQIFQRLHTEAEYEGLGIGLALCKRIIERHGGRIWVESTPGKGSTFLFTIPVRTETL
jgi:PAS domain S-box-containing protein